MHSAHSAPLSNFNILSLAFNNNVIYIYMTICICLLMCLAIIKWRLMFEVCLRDSQLHHHIVEMLWELPNRCHEVQSSRFLWRIVAGFGSSVRAPPDLVIRRQAYMKLHFFPKVMWKKHDVFKASYEISLQNARYIHLRQRIRKIKRTDQNSLGPKFDNLFSMMMANKKEHLRWNVRRYMID